MLAVEAIVLICLIMDQNFVIFTTKNEKGWTKNELYLYRERNDQ